MIPARRRRVVYALAGLLVVGLAGIVPTEGARTEGARTEGARTEAARTEVASSEAVRTATSPSAQHPTMELFLSIYERHHGTPDAHVRAEAHERAAMIESWRDALPPPHPDPTDILTPHESNERTVHVGEVWTVCNSWWAPCETNYLPSDWQCFSSVYINEAYAQHVSTLMVVEVDRGTHFSLTETYLGVSAEGTHQSGTVVGPTCIGPFFGILLTMTNGFGVFET